MAVTTERGISQNAAGAISYFTFLPAIAFLLIRPYKESPCVRFHAWQSILIFFTASAVHVVLGAIALLTIFLATGVLARVFWLVALFWLVLWLACVIRAMQGKRLKLPIIGAVAEKLSIK